MHFEYIDKADLQINEILGGLAEFEDLLVEALRNTIVDRVAVIPMTPGLSGAAVFRINRVNGSHALLPWIAKVAKEYELIRRERDNYKNYIVDKCPNVPTLINTGAGAEFDLRVRRPTCFV
jgi:hypothetical protein